MGESRKTPAKPPVRPLDGYGFEDYRLGQRFVHATPRTVTQGDVSLYQALTGSRLPLHCSEPFAQALGYPAMPVDDLLVFHIAFGKTVADVSYNAVANLGYADCRFLRPVYIGDTLRAESQVIGLKANSNGKTGVVYVRSDAFNQRGERVLTWARWVMVAKRDERAAPPETSVPDLPETAGVPDAPACLLAGRWDNAATGSPRRLGDYTLGQVIDHPAGMTVDETDHTLATKLYQNNARVHFDAHFMTGSRFGKRLVYGGHVISVCRSLSYDGLENVLGLACVNGGRHLNPTFGGDTIYAKSVVVGKLPLAARGLGAIRLRLIGIKNAEPGAIDHDKPSDQIVLDLDYTAFIPL
jgi:2-methylfumaryl-CoA hydratase